ncbi:Cys-tRNA(Pro) deacylase [Enterococcus sp. LJL99]
MAKKKKNQKTNVMRVLEQHKITYKDYGFEWSEDHLGAEEAAERIGIDYERVFKTLVAVGNKTGPLVAVIPGTKELNLKNLAQASGNKKVEMLPLKDLEETTGYIRGGCSPIGMKKIFPTFLAEEAKSYEQIVVSAGQRGKQVALDPQKIAELINGKFAEITE